jgi:hypothetical protein
MTNDEWLDALHKKLKELHSVKNWKTADEIGNELKEWVAKNPRPIPKAPSVTPLKATNVSGVGNMNKKIHTAQTFYRLRGSRGFINVAALVAAGTASAAAIGTAVLAYAAEEAAVAAVSYAYDTSMTMIREASTPSTKAECRLQYNNFVKQQQMSTFHAQTGLGLRNLPSEKDWFETTYGIRYDILK